MKSLIYLLISIIIASICTSAQASVIYSGYEFNENAFADSIYSYSRGSNVGSPYYNSNRALGQPDNAFTSLGVGGRLIVEFTDNSLTTSGDSSADLFIFEVGSAVEYFNVAISVDGSSWINLGNIRGQPAAIDIDSKSGVTLWERYSFVRLTDISPTQSSYPYAEADIDAVAAISSSFAVAEPAHWLMMVFGLLGMTWGGRARKTKT